jgi:hypothetical protein
MNDADHAVQTLMNLFPNMDDQGELPDLVDDRYVNITATKPPIHGLAALIFLKRFGNELTPEHCRKMYEGLSKLCDYWTRKRGFGQTLPFYKHGCESGYDFSAMFAKGAPVIGPDLLSYCILLSEACGKLAEQLNLTDSSKWFDLSERLLTVLLSDFWTGTRFAARLADSYEIVEFDELEAYLPMILGGRLPENIINAMAEELADPERYFTPFGLRSQPKAPGSQGVIMGFSQVKILPGLYEAGKNEFAVSVMRGFTELCAEKGPSFFHFEPIDGAAAETGDNLGDLTALSALAAAEFLLAASFLKEVSADA